MKQLQPSKLLVLSLLSIIILLPAIMNAQSRSRGKAKSSTHFTLQGGLYYDFGKRGVISTSQLDFKKLGIGMLRFNNNHASQFILEASFSSKVFGLESTTTPSNPNPEYFRGFEKRSQLIEIEYFKSFIKQKELDNKLHVGYTFNANFSRNNILPYPVNQFQEIENCLQIGAGLKVLYLVPLSKKVKLTISSDLNLIDFGPGIIRDFSPNIFVDDQTTTVICTQLLRRRIGIDIGLAF